MTVLDYGCAMGFFSLPLADMVGPGGLVMCVDFQKPMIDALRRRATKAGLAERIETHICEETRIGLNQRKGTFDLALAVAVLHEVPDPSACLTEICDLLKPGASLLLAEPKAHVSESDFEQTVDRARESGLERTERLSVWFCRAALLNKSIE
jgi:2-polyprenyl-3-methyl-5-hydroxy-6-metoxy-1,4-benzoquinol methylase